MCILQVVGTGKEYSVTANGDGIIGINFCYMVSIMCECNGLLYTVDWTRGLNSRRCVDKKSNCNIQLIMMIVISTLA